MRRVRVPDDAGTPKRSGGEKMSPAIPSVALMKFVHCRRGHIVAYVKTWDDKPLVMLLDHAIDEKATGDQGSVDVLKARRWNKRRGSIRCDICGDMREFHAF
jgi:hypothetical protein